MLEGEVIQSDKYGNNDMSKQGNQKKKKHDWIQVGAVTVDSNEASTKQRKSQEREFSEHEANVSDLFL